MKFPETSCGRLSCCRTIGLDMPSIWSSIHQKMLALCSLGLTATSCCHVVSSSSRDIATTASVFWVASPSLVAKTITIRCPAATTHPAPIVETTSVSIRARTTFFNVYLLASYLMRICGHSGIITRSISKLYESTILFIELANLCPFN